jgi:hypothetical protein
MIEDNTAAIAAQIEQSGRDTAETNVCGASDAPMFVSFSEGCHMLLRIAT